VPVVLTDDMKQLVDRELGFVATVCPDGTPNLSPKGTIAVWDDSHLVFADIHSPGTTRNLRANPNIEVDVVDQLARRGYRFKGTATVHADGVEFERGVELYERRGTPDARGRIQAIVVIAVERALAVRSPAYDLGATEAELSARYLRRLTEQHRRSEHSERS
jgi:predicted pyridoxine 5'-phosphate oxidase superfamily flavin-nucleotide-binding protein